MIDKLLSKLSLNKLSEFYLDKLLSEASLVFNKTVLRSKQERNIEVKVSFKSR